VTTDNFVDRDEILPLLGPVKRNGEWLMAFCPAHADGTKGKGKEGQSLGLSDRGVLHCFAGCDFKAIMEALRGPAGRREPVALRNDNELRLVRVYEYRRPDGLLMAEKSRWETMGGSKTFRWRLPGAEQWKGLEGMDSNSLPLYGSEMIADRPDEPVYFVEGEKSAEACWEHGLLAVTACGGAGQKTFGDSLQVLKGREVRLWPDNDAPGRSHMSLLSALLQPVAKKLLWVQVELGEKEDAADYFRRGGKLSSLVVADPNDVMLTVLGEESVQVIVPTEKGPATLRFEEMEKTGRGLDTFLTISVRESGDYPFQQQINLSSASAWTELRRTLDAMYGKDYNWADIWNKAQGMARRWYLEQDRSQDVAEIPEPLGDVLLAPPFIVADGPTAVFGDGSSLKSYWCFTLACCMAAGIPFAGFATPKLRTMVVDYEDSASNFRRRIGRIFAGLGAVDVDHGYVRYWAAKGIPLADQAEAIKRACEKHGVGMLIIDSAAPACGGDPSEPHTTLAFFSALKKIGLPAVIIAHVSKGSDTQKPFGSVFWHNESRRTWFVERVQEEDSDELDVGLFCRKVNDGTKPRPIGFHVEFDGADGPVTIELGNIENTPALVDRTSAQNQVWYALRQGPMTIAELAEVVEADRKTILKVLQRGPFVAAGMRESASAGGRPASLWARRDDTRREPGRATGDHWH
jgi:hypothetical protein